jgi:hypothetical protein
MYLRKDMKNVQSKNLYFDKHTGESIFITSIVDYEGTKEKVVYIRKGYGANEKTEKQVMSYEEFNLFCDKLVTKMPLIMNEEKPELEKKSSNNFDEMREILFDTLRQVKSGKFDESKAKTICVISQTLINSARVEIDYIKTVSNKNKSNLLD